ncbi:hypothetical protein [Acrocarpospora catenulata]|uniref:hypothetical protein n=1 Tax=Acrocarpospora catenulata TaxID=2836182 RepID=UPI001BDA01F2|nr:hypothetical protein [Acrocarpospora catenulata]
MLDQNQREDRYLAQTGRTTLTAAQRRRLQHKAGHQLADAAAAREENSQTRAAVRERRKAARESFSTAQRTLSGLLAR